MGLTYKPDGMSDGRLRAIKMWIKEAEASAPKWASVASELVAEVDGLKAEIDGMQQADAFSAQAELEALRGKLENCRQALIEEKQSRLMAVIDQPAEEQPRGIDNAWDNCDEGVDFPEPQSDEPDGYEESLGAMVRDLARRVKALEDGKADKGHYHYTKTAVIGRPLNWDTER